MAYDPDGSLLLTSPDVGDLLRTAVEHAGGCLVSWRLDHVDANPGLSTTATYAAVVDWAYGRREELLGASARAGRLTRGDHRAEVFFDGEREVAVWLYPKDPDLPGLVRAAYADDMASILNESRVFTFRIRPEDVRLDMIGYRPRRRAVLKATVARHRTVLYTKVLRPGPFAAVKRRHELLLGAGVPAPVIAAATPDNLLVLRRLPGVPLARAVFEPQDPCTAENLIEVLDSMPAGIAGLERRPPWADAVAHYATMVTRALPGQERRLAWMVRQIEAGLKPIPPGSEPTHGDFHEGQLHVMGGRICGILDVDTAGPGSRADDLACLIAHLSTVQRMNHQQASRVHSLIRAWVPVFDERVDPTELRLRAAAVIISLATGPFRTQEANWQRETSKIVDAAEALVRQVT
ncbi:phosphotransferase [Propionicicella superfundia]|uniref:phosphotransferase n=1 Tax=Propionicicella superfundia TaxID=348582 RepID=UPI00040DD3DF|nr:phosphotransferase [Propionicicella superfundia]